jgi:hypothetical protein
LILLRRHALLNSEVIIFCFLKQELQKSYELRNLQSGTVPA